MQIPLTITEYKIYTLSEKVIRTKNSMVVISALVLGSILLQVTPEVSPIDQIKSSWLMNIIQAGGIGIILWMLRGFGNKVTVIFENFTLVVHRLTNNEKEIEELKKDHAEHVKHYMKEYQDMQRQITQLISRQKD